MESLAYIYIAQTYEQATLNCQQVLNLVSNIEMNDNKIEIDVLNAYAYLNS
jgi:hypothetical protein